MRLVVGGDGGYLEAETNKLLRKAGAGRDTHYPAYTEKYMEFKEIRRGDGVSLEQLFYETTPQGLPGVDDLFECMWGEIISGAHYVNLTERQLQFLRYRKIGLTYKEIADETGWGETTVRRDLTQAAERIQRIPQFGLWSVLSEIFGISVRRIGDMILHQQKNCGAREL